MPYQGDMLIPLMVSLEDVPPISIDIPRILVLPYSGIAESSTSDKLQIQNPAQESLKKRCEEMW